MNFEQELSLLIELNFNLSARVWNQESSFYELSCNEAVYIESLSLWENMESQYIGFKDMIVPSFVIDGKVIMFLEGQIMSGKFIEYVTFQYMLKMLDLDMEFLEILSKSDFSILYEMYLIIDKMNEEEIKALLKIQSYKLEDKKIDQYCIKIYNIINLYYGEFLKSIPNENDIDIHSEYISYVYSDFFPRQSIRTLLAMIPENFSSAKITKVILKLLKVILPEIKDSNTSLDFQGIEVFDLEEYFYIAGLLVSYESEIGDRMEEYILRYYYFISTILHKGRKIETSYIKNPITEDVIMATISMLLIYENFDEAINLYRQGRRIIGYSGGMTLWILNAFGQSIKKLPNDFLFIIKDDTMKYMRNMIPDADFSIDGMYTYIENKHEYFLKYLKEIEEIDKSLIFELYPREFKKFLKLYNHDMYNNLNIDFRSFSLNDAISMIKYLEHFSFFFLQGNFSHTFINLMENTVFEDSNLHMFALSLFKPIMDYIDDCEYLDNMLQTRKDIISKELKANVDQIDFYESENVDVISQLLYTYDLIDNAIINDENTVIKVEENVISSYALKIDDAMKNLEFERFHPLYQAKYKDNKLFEDYPHNNKLIKYLASAEYVWNNYSRDDVNIVDYTPAISLFIKATEMMLIDSIFKFSKAKINKNKQLFMQRIDRKRVLATDRKLWDNNISLGSLQHFLKDYQRNHLEYKELENLIQSVERFTITVRNAKFHTSMVDTYYDASAIRIQCLETIKIIIIDISFLTTYNQ